MKIERIYLSPIAAYLFRLILLLLVGWSSYVVIDLVVNEFEQPQTIKWGIEIDFYSYLMRHVAVDLIGLYMLFFVVKVKR
ncbi:hypothetical protein VEZ01S_45_00880 [Vibrio ezurae NBRC 102218]|uniref:Uncharacterized protein n=1 Tax=Vibrio ezurae NBRC 102218 TaxID=1219080 RepID=U3B6A3_9VIBR|nr:hypothetical protein VEZ01S_45_00880 [Vibrio ezurae NBRC 102218]